jgi:hypothetical protein
LGVGRIEIVPERNMLLADRRRVAQELKPVIADLEKKGDSPVMREQIDRLVRIVGRQEQIIDEAGKEILRHMR